MNKYIEYLACEEYLDDAPTEAKAFAEWIEKITERAQENYPGYEIRISIRLCHDEYEITWIARRDMTSKEIEDERLRELSIAKRRLEILEREVRKLEVGE